ncbi:lon protease homolog 2, peroxisomal isoform X1 [Petromyzon marinus]|uniref:Lon protease homolog 2, peroxisomal n=1 Tax=Petromyzon marinus TaxID=7757 RepID=A0AAJ7TBD5_PETMA|nr:lon protease homolog 2, peroxisomal isoform X1 [Petromyzon marinus]
MDKGGLRIPERLPLLLAADAVLLPGASARLGVDSARNMGMVRARLLRGASLRSSVIGVLPHAAEPADDEEGSDAQGLAERVGTAAVVVQVTGSNWPRPHYTLLVTGLCRFRVLAVRRQHPYILADVQQLDRLGPGPDLENGRPGASSDGNETSESSAELTELTETFYKHARKLAGMLDMSVPVVAQLRRLLDSLPSEDLPDIVASIVRTSRAEKLQVLEAVELEERFRRTIPLLVRQIEGVKLINKARRSDSSLLDNKVLPGRLGRREGAAALGGRKALLGLSGEDGDEEEDDIASLERKVRSCGMTDVALRVCTKEIKRLRKMPQTMPEFALTRNYLELMVELPWSKCTTDRLDLAAARVLLDNDHYGLERLKQRVLEYLAVRQLRPGLRGPILCFVGPPGVGKTSVGRSIARTLGREFHRISLGGICDQSDIRGHRRTYVGSMPGRVISGMKAVGVRNPVFLLDEVDKLGKGLQGDPAAALLEVLDPEQNSTFTDHYLNVPFDLCQVLFIATANATATIPPALLDRMEIIQVPGYTQEEKVEIACRHLVPKQLEQHGLTEAELSIPSVSVALIVSRYTREAGVRSLERKVAAVCRAVAVKVAESRGPKSGDAGSHGPGQDHAKADLQDDLGSAESQEKVQHRPIDPCDPPEMPIVIDAQALKDILGPPAYEMEVSERLSQPGVAIGLAWTPVGGEIMFVEATRAEGEGQLTLTGQLGEVMKESARLAISWLRSNARTYGLVSASGGADPLDGWDVHLHFPAGAVTKDGPSAGAAIAVCLASLLSGRTARSDTAITGEITLRGLVLPVGGIKEKVLAAHRAGLKRVVLPRRNEKDLEEVSRVVRDQLDVVLARTLEDVLNATFSGGFPAQTPSLINSKL